MRLVVALVAAAMLGAERLPFFDLNEQQRSILYDIRLPRILLGACVGASLAVAGAGLQSLLQESAGRALFAWCFERGGIGDDAGVRVFSES